MAKISPPASDAATVNSEAPAALESPVINAIEVTPAAGGSYTRDPATGALTLVTPSTTQE
jgi:hypothetical protein